MAATKHTVKGQEIILRDDRLLQLVFKDGFYPNRQEVKTYVETLHDICGESALKVLVDIRELGGVSVKDFRWGDDHTIGLFEASAILAGSPMTRLIGSFFVQFTKQPVRIKMFLEEEKALSWLRNL